MMLRKADGVGVFGDVVDSHAPTQPGDGPEQSVTCRWRTDSLCRLAVHAHVDELGNEPVGADHAKSPVAGSGQVHRRSDDRLERPGQLGRAGHRGSGTDEPGNVGWGESWLIHGREGYRPFDARTFAYFEWAEWPLLLHPPGAIRWHDFARSWA